MMKKDLIHIARETATKKLQQLENQITELSKDLNSETKSSAGDKHETGRAMIQLEMEKLSDRMALAKHPISILNSINPEIEHQTVALGSVVETTTACYFISAPLGVINYQEKKYYAIGKTAPIAQVLMGKQIDDTIVFNGISSVITSVL